MPADDAPGFLGALLDTVRALEVWFARCATPHAYIGGFAVAFIGDPRVTHDVDGIVQVEMEALQGFWTTGQELGFEQRDEKDPVVDARDTYVLRARYRPSGIDVDLSLAFTDFENQAIRHSTGITAKGVTFPILTAENLLVMKAFARRVKDVRDIAGILNRHPDLDLEAVRAWLRLFDVESDQPPYLADFDDLVARWRLRG